MKSDKDITKIKSNFLAVVKYAMKFKNGQCTSFGGINASSFRGGSSDWFSLVIYSGNLSVA